jgi:hypothetical protein
MNPRGQSGVRIGSALLFGIPDADQRSADSGRLPPPI